MTGECHAELDYLARTPAIYDPFTMCSRYSLLRPSEITCSPIVYLMISLVAALLYLPALGFDFVYDDHYQVLTNRSVLSGDRSIGSVLKLFLEATFPGDLYRPITVISYRLNYLVTGLSANAFHLINITYSTYLKFPL